MQYSKQIFVAALVGVLSAPMANSAPTAEEAAQLGKTLTPLGAIKAGNKEGTIPEWTGGLCAAPAGYKPANGIDGGPYVNPFAAEKPLFKISAENMAQYADKLDEGTKLLMSKYPKTFYVAVYPTHRSACFQKHVYENTVKKVMNPKLVWTGGAPGLTDAHAQIPFPIPKSGVEVMWNAVVRPDLPLLKQDYATWLVDSSGGLHDTTTSVNVIRNLYWDTSLTSVPENMPYWTVHVSFTAPPSMVGNLQLLYYYLRADLKGSPAWSYVPGQRRVRLAPEFSYDGVNTQAGGFVLWDEINGFSGKMDKYDFKLLGRKEMYVPYNTYDIDQAPRSAITPNHPDPSLVRFELHRVWQVEATLKPGERHVQKKKIFYIDEDSWNMTIYLGIDHAGHPHHFLYVTGFQHYDQQYYQTLNSIQYDFSKGGGYFFEKELGESNKGVPTATGIHAIKSLPASFFLPESMAGGGTR